MLLASGLSKEEVLVVMNRKKRNECALEGVCGCFAFYEVYMASEESSLSYEFDGKALGTITLTATAASPM